MMTGLNMLAPDRLNAVRQCLTEATALADSFIAGHHDFPSQVAEWLSKLESTTREAGLAVVPLVAGLRVEVDAARQGFLPASEPDGGRMKRRSARKAAAQSALRSAIDLVSAAVEPFEARRMRAENIALDVAAKSFAKGLWPGQSDVPGAPGDMPSMWRAMLADPLLAPMIMELSALQGMAQSMVLVANAMNSFAGTASGATQ